MRNKGTVRRTLLLLGIVTLVGCFISFAFREIGWLFVGLIGAGATAAVWHLGVYVRSIEASREEDALKLLREVVVGLKNEDILRRHNRLREEFLDTVAHDFRTPLTAVYGFSKALFESQSSEIDRNAVRYIYQGAEELKQLLDRLTLSRSFNVKEHAIAPSKIHPEHIIGNAVSRSRTLFESFEVDVVHGDTGEKCIEMACDVELLTDVLIGLLGQVCEYAVKGSKVSVSATQDEGVTCFSITWMHSGGGIDGIAPLVAQFHPSDPSSLTSIGNGVTFAVNIAALHNGTVSLIQLDPRRAAIEVKVPLSEVQSMEERCPLDSMH